jgi:hypothetical protein
MLVLLQRVQLEIEQRLHVLLKRVLPLWQVEQTLLELQVVQFVIEQVVQEDIPLNVVPDGQTHV